MKRPQPFLMCNLVGMSKHDINPMFMLYAAPELQAVAHQHPGVMAALSGEVEVRILIEIDPRYDPETVWLEIAEMLEEAVKSGEYVELDKTVWGEI